MGGVGTRNRAPHHRHEGATPWRTPRLPDGALSRHRGGGDGDDPPLRPGHGPRMRLRIHGRSVQCAEPRGGCASDGRRPSRGRSTGDRQLLAYAVDAVCVRPASRIPASADARDERTARRRRRIEQAFRSNRRRDVGVRRHVDLCDRRQDRSRSRDHARGSASIGAAATVRQIGSVTGSARRCVSRSAHRAPNQFARIPVARRRRTGDASGTAPTRRRAADERPIASRSCAPTASATCPRRGATTDSPRDSKSATRRDTENAR